ncbi:MAG: lipase, partial [Clostridia bacterium]|nr:lipase [Clostridia bacterium]
MRETNNYPFILIHGFLCWGNEDRLNDIIPTFGMWNGSAKVALLDAGYTADTPSVGMFSGIWDRACELYAKIKGGRVDYGKVHSERCGHDRYGKTYPGIVPNWGELDDAGKIQKVNLIGHSFGGPTMRQLIHLLAEGSEEERAGTPEDELSDLFKGGKVKWVHSCTALAGTVNGVTLPEQIAKFIVPVECVVGALAMVSSGTWLSKVYGFHLDRFGVSSQTKHVSFDPTLIQHFVGLKEDNIGWELGRELCQELSKDFHVYDNIYYFSYYGVRTAINKKGKMAGTKDMWFAMKPFARLAGNINIDQIGKEWAPNDGLVNVPSAHHPFNDPWQD